MGFLHCFICPPYGEIKKLWNTSLVPIQWAKPHDATKMPQLLCVKLEDPKKFTSQALRRSRAVIHLRPTTSNFKLMGDGLMVCHSGIVAWLYYVIHR